MPSPRIPLSRLVHTAILALAGLVLSACSASCGVEPQSGPGASSSAAAAEHLAEVRAHVTRIAADPVRASVSGVTSAHVRVGLAAFAPQPLSEAALADIAARMAEVRARPIIKGHVLAAYVVDLDTGQVVFEESPDLPVKPASNTKMFTTGAAFALLGEDHRFTTSVYATTPADERGVLTGDVYLVGHNDFTWSSEFYNGPRVPLHHLAKQIAAAGVTRIKGTVRATGEFLFEGFRYDRYSAEKHRNNAQRQFRATLNNVGVNAAKGAYSETIPKLDDAQLLATWESLPLGAACAPLNRMSHNEFADSLSRYLGWKVGGPAAIAALEAEIAASVHAAELAEGGTGKTISDTDASPEGSAGEQKGGDGADGKTETPEVSPDGIKADQPSAPRDPAYEAGGVVVREWLAGAGVDTTGMVFHDGSGLSHDNRVTARQVVGLMQVMLEGPGGERWLRGMSIAGENGTFVGRLKGADTRGRVFAKSGTLNGVLAASGVLMHRHDGHRYAFSLILNETRSRNGGRRALDAMVRIVAEDHRAVGPRPGSPVLTSVRSAAHGGGAWVTWGPSPDADVYRVWTSSDGHTWERTRVHHTTETHFHIRDVAPGERVYVRVSAANRAGESDASDVYGVRVADERAAVLVVDANDRWDHEPASENAIALGHAFAAQVAASLPDDAGAYDTVANEAVEMGMVDLGAYQAVVWGLGEEAAESVIFSATEQELIREYTGGGGALMVSGSEWAFGLANGTASDRAFLKDVLRTELVLDDARTSLVEGAGGVCEGMPVQSFYSPTGMDVKMPDRIAPGTGAASCLHYVGGARGDAALTADDGYRIMVMGFPVEALSTAALREKMMAVAMRFLLGR